MAQFEQFSSQEYLDARGIRTIVSLGVYAAAPETGYAKKYGELPEITRPIDDIDEPYESTGFGD